MNFIILLECPLYRELRKNPYIKPYYWKRLNMPKFIEKVHYEILKLRKKTLFWLVCPSRFLFVYTCSWFVDMSLYVCIMNVYMFVYWLYTERHFCLLYSVINSWNSYTTSQCKCLVTYVRYSSTLVYNTSSETVIQIVLHF